MIKKEGDIPMLQDTAVYLLGGIIIIGWQAIALLTRQPLGKNLLLSLFLAYLTGVAAVTCFPVIYDAGVVEKADVNLLPFATIASLIQSMFTGASYSTPLLQLVGNIVLAIPYGVCLGFLVKRKTWWKLLLFAPLLSVSVELIQLILGLSTATMYRAVDIDDVLLNTFGAWIGIGVFYLLPGCVKSFFSKPKKAFNV